MTCSHCHGEVRSLRVRRFPPGAVAAGWVLSILGAAAAVAFTGYAFTNQPAPSPAIDVEAVEKEAAIARLRQLGNVSPEAIAEFETTAEVPDHLLERMDPDLRGEVDLIVSDYRYRVRTAQPPAPPAPWWTAWWLKAAWTASLAALIAGAVLRVRKDQDRCPLCGSPFDEGDSII